MAEALLDLAGLDRALEAQRRPGSKLRFVGLVCHSIPSSNLRQPSRPKAGSPPSRPRIGVNESAPPDKRVSDTRSGGGIGQRDMYHILAPKCHRQDSARLREYQPPRTRRRRPARPGRERGCRPRRHPPRGSAGGPCPARAAVSIRSEPLMRLPARASIPRRSSAAWRSACPVRSPRSAGTVDVVGLERALERGLEFALGIGRVELGAATPIHAPRPGARARTSGATSPSGDSASRISSSSVPCDG